jgi:predicted GH43/DUF377 family glycosyl hydrolase
MNIKNLDYLCYTDAVQKQREHQEDWLKNGFAPKGFYLKDFCLIKEKGLYHLFHIAGTPGVTCCLPGNELWFGHATTKDFVHWETHEPCFYIDINSWDNGHVFAPYVVKAFDKFWMFYTGVAIDNTQRIGVATSLNLFDWKRAQQNPVIRPEEYYWAFCPTEKGAPCRDPHVCLWGDEYSLYYTAVTKTGKGCIARASSKYLLNWKDEGPVFETDKLDHPESCNVQKLGDKYLLFYGGHYEWSYVISDNPSDWRGGEPIALQTDITAMEVIERQEDKWLVAYFKMDNYRLFLGVIDWSLTKPKIVEIHKPKSLIDFFGSQNH